tara:strand:- start:693 stop:1142 length:450 start_codon:yes stop_codon:yes gene_type:complete
MDDIANEIETMGGVDALVSLLKDEKEREKIKNAFLFSLKTIPGSAMYFKLLDTIRRKGKSSNVPSDVAPELLYNWAASYLALQLSSNDVYTSEEKQNLFVFYYVILKRLIWVFVYSLQGRLDTKGSYFLEYGTGVLKDTFESLALGSRR